MTLAGATALSVDRFDFAHYRDEHKSLHPMNDSPLPKAPFTDGGGEFFPRFMPGEIGAGELEMLFIARRLMRNQGAAFTDQAAADDGDMHGMER